VPPKSAALRMDGMGYCTKKFKVAILKQAGVVHVHINHSTVGKIVTYLYCA